MWEEIGGGSPRAVPSGVAQRGEASDGGGDRWSSGVPEWSVMGYTLNRSSWGRQWGRPWPEAAVHMEALAVAQVEGIWQRRHGPEVDGTARGLGSCLALPHSLGRRAWGQTVAGGMVLGGEAAWLLREQSRRRAALASTMRG
jgi:hypothetical protein